MSQKMPEDTRQLAGKNTGTLVRPAPATAEAAPAPSSRAPTPREAFLIAYHRMAALASASRDPQAIVIAAARPSGVADARLVEPRRALIIGRHTQCGLRLNAPPVSLRHLAMLVLVEPDTGRPAVRLWDLSTQMPFRTEDGRFNAAVMTDGSMYLSLDEFGLWLMPVRGIFDHWPASAENAWDMLPPREFIDRREAQAGRPAEARGVRGQGPTTITTLGPPLRLQEGGDLEPPWGEIRLGMGNQRERRTVSAERLGQGILIGRYDRCALPLERDAGEISRVHVLLVRVGSEVWAIDTASTNGVWRGQQPVVAEVLGDSDTIDLGGVATLSWRRLVYPQT